jgi:hypothetical protein
MISMHILFISAACASVSASVYEEQEGQVLFLAFYREKFITLSYVRLFGAK